VDNVHGAHGAAGVVEHPLLVKVEVVRADLLLQFAHDVADHGTRVVSMRRNCALRQVVQMGRLEDVEPVEVLVEVVEERRERSEQQRKDGQRGSAAATAFGGRLLGGGHWRGDCSVRHEAQQDCFRAESERKRKREVCRDCCLELLENWVRGTQSGIVSGSEPEPPTASGAMANHMLRTEYMVYGIWYAMHGKCIWSTACMM
jgi:hypothetical protein